MIIVYVLILIMLWQLLGCIVLSTIDDEQQSIFTWAKEFPVFGFSVSITIWPFIIYLWLREKYLMKSNAFGNESRFITKKINEE